MAGGEGGSGDRSLHDTPTWAVAGVCAIFIILSILLEHALLQLGKLFQKRQKRAMIDALEKVKAELMLMGFISLLLTAGTRAIPKICISPKLGRTMLPCSTGVDDDHSYKDDGGGEGERRKLLSFDDFHGNSWHRMLAGAEGGADYCSSKGKVPLISVTGVHQLHIFVFVLAVFHILYCVITMTLGRAKVKKWKTWESETSSMEYQFTNDPTRFRLAHQTSFVKRHSGIFHAPGIRWIVAFFRQFSGSITKVDYLTMRNGFINAHLNANAKFDFHRYIKRCMEDDFKVVVGISFPLWIFAILFMLLNVHRFHLFIYVTGYYLVQILLVVGTKLELVIMDMAQQIQERSTVVRGAPIVEPDNRYFWFNRPHWILLLIHYTLFQNAFQMSYVLWNWYEFKFNNCFRENTAAILVRMSLAVILQFICSYITFPLYSLVTQMGSNMKQAIFEEQTAKALKKWQKAAQDRKKKFKGGSGGGGSQGLTSGESTPSTMASPVHLLHNFKYRSNEPDIEDVPCAPCYHSDTDVSELESGGGGGSSDHNGHEPFPTTNPGRATNAPAEFTFVKL
ncbi:MLO protein homolog 1 [Linum perenne]